MNSSVIPLSSVMEESVLTQPLLSRTENTGHEPQSPALFQHDAKVSENLGILQTSWFSILR
jgi:hypothetical protein